MEIEEGVFRLNFADVTFPFHSHLHGLLSLFKIVLMSYFSLLIPSGPFQRRKGLVKIGSMWTDEN